MNVQDREKMNAKEQEIAKLQRECDSLFNKLTASKEYAEKLLGGNRMLQEKERELNFLLNQERDQSNAKDEIIHDLQTRTGNMHVDCAKLQGELDNEKTNSAMFRFLANDSDINFRTLQMKYKDLELRYSNVTEIIKQIPNAWESAHEMVNLTGLKSFIKRAIISQRKSGIYEVRFNGATSNVWLRWCENNKHFEAYGTAQKYYDKDMSYVDPNMAYDWSPRPF